eukprot:1187503-Prorocentrum_minimum.AAC.2
MSTLGGRGGVSPASANASRCAPRLSPTSCAERNTAANKSNSATEGESLAHKRGVNVNSRSGQYCCT